MKLSIVISCAIFYFFIQTLVCAQQVGPVQKKEVQNNIHKSISDTVKVETINSNSTIDQIEIDRLIVDETISKAGYEFLELFLSQWNWPPALTESFILVVTERPFRGISTQIVITINDLVVFESFLQTRYDVLEYLSEMANEQAVNYIMNYEIIIKQLEGDDTQGSGIY